MFETELAAAGSTAQGVCSHVLKAPQLWCSLWPWWAVLSRVGFGEGAGYMQAQRTVCKRLLVQEREHRFCERQFVSQKQCNVVVLMKAAAAAVARLALIVLRYACYRRCG